MELQDRCRGLMVGLAAGNLLGILCEGWPREEIRLRWPDGVRDIEAKPGYPDDDDLAQAVILVEECRGGDELDAADLARRFWVWGEENGLGMGYATERTLARYGGSRPGRYGSRDQPAPRQGSAPSSFPVAREPVGLPALEASRAAWEGSGGKAAGNGAVMRCAPLAIRWRHDDVALVRNTVCSAAVTHWDSRCIWSSGVREPRHRFSHSGTAGRSVAARRARRAGVGNAWRCVGALRRRRARAAGGDECPGRYGNYNAG